MRGAETVRMTFLGLLRLPRSLVPVNKGRNQFCLCLLVRGAAKQRAVNTSLLMVTRFVIVDILRNYMEKAKHVLYLTIFVFFNLVNSMV